MMAAPKAGRQTFKMDVRDYNKMLGQLAAECKKHGFSTADVIKGECATVTASAAELTQRASAADIDKRYTLKRVPKSGKNKGKNPNTSDKLIPFVKMNGKFYSTRRKYPAHIFQEMQKKLDFYKKRAKTRIYSAKAVWLVVCKKARCFTGRFKQGAQLLKAISAQGGKYKTNQTNDGDQRGSGNGFSIKLYTENTCLLNKNAKGNFAIASAMARRGRYFEMNMEKGAFKTAKRIAGRYPGIVLKGRKGAPV